jgi:FtsZ-interacting cell division protein ZipA
MSTTEVIIVVVAAIVVLALIAWAMNRAMATRRLERRREHAGELRDEGREHHVAAHRAQADADRMAAEASEARAQAEEQAAIARQREEDAAEHARVAERRRDQAADSRREADELDPDGAPRATRPEPRGAEDGVTDEDASQRPAEQRL